LHPQVVRFAFSVTAVTGEQQLKQRATKVQDLARGLRIVEHLLTDDGSCNKPKLTGLSRECLTRRMARGDMCDFMPQHDSELCFVLQMAQQPARDIDVTSGQRKGVDDGAVHHAELERGGPILFGGPWLAEIALLENTLSNRVYVIAQCRILVLAELLEHLLVGLAAQLLFLFPTVSIKASFPGHRADLPHTASGAEEKQRQTHRGLSHVVSQESQHVLHLARGRPAAGSATV
jgi:hypothetical protein